MNLKEVAQKMADLMHDMPVGDAFAVFAAISRGVKDEDGNFVLKGRAAGYVNVAALNRYGIRELAKQERDKERGMRNGMRINDDGLALDDLGDEEAAQLRAVDMVKAKGGEMFAASQQMNNPDGLEFTGDAVRAVAARVANANVEKETSAADAEMRRVAETSAAGRGTGGRGGPGRRISWKAVAAERNAQHQDEVAALQARIRELEAERAARGGGGGAPAVNGE
jgi:hypothetical protein